MTSPLRLAGVDGGLVDADSDDINFFVNVEGGGMLSFVTSSAVAEQVAAELGRMSRRARPAAARLPDARKAAR